MGSLIKAIKELMMYVLLGAFFGGILLIFVNLLAAVSY